MIGQKSSGTLSSASVLSAVASSLCCITPVAALLAGSSSIVQDFSWMEPARPYLLGVTNGILAFAWYLKVKPVKTSGMGCNCETTKKLSFLQSKSFLGIVTLFAILMKAFPLYAKVFYPKAKVLAATVTAASNKQQVKFSIQGMTCEDCEEHINNELSKVAGILAYKASYAYRSSVVTFDKSKIDVKTIEAAINKTGYQVTGFYFLNSNQTREAKKEAACAFASKSCCKKR